MASLLILVALTQVESEIHEMMISQPAIMCLEATWRRIVQRSFGIADPSAAPDSGPTIIEDEAEVMPVVAATIVQEATARGAGPGVGQSAASEGPLTAAERRARAAALRALALSRGRHFDAARAAFIDAARLDPRLDLTRTPAFWKLERSAHEAAIDAYVAVGRDRDAAVLRARVRSTFRPKALRPKQPAAMIP